MLRLQFLRENDAKIDLREGIIKLSGLELEIPDFNMAFKNSIESRLADRFKRIEEELNKNNNHNLKAILNKAKRANPELGHIQAYKHKLNSTKYPYTNKRLYAIPKELTTELNIEIEHLLDAGIIRKSDLTITLPCYPLVKKNSKIRLIVDYGRINAVTRLEKYSFPTIEEQSIGLKDAMFF